MRNPIPYFPDVWDKIAAEVRAVALDYWSTLLSYWDAYFWPILVVILTILLITFIWIGSAWLGAPRFFLLYVGAGSAIALLIFGFGPFIYHPLIRRIKRLSRTPFPE